MMIKHKLAALVFSAAFFLPGMASAVVLTFDSLTGTTIGPYSESGYTFTLSGGSTPHFGDAGPSGTLNWHDGGANASGVINNLTGATFSLTQFDLVSGTVTIAGTTYSTAGTYALSQINVANVAFDVASSVAIDNLHINDVPVPGTTALLGLGLLGLGIARRRRT